MEQWLEQKSQLEEKIEAQEQQRNTLAQKVDELRQQNEEFVRETGKRVQEIQQGRQEILEAGSNRIKPIAQRNLERQELLEQADHSLGNVQESSWLFDIYFSDEQKNELYEALGSDLENSESLEQTQAQLASFLSDHADSIKSHESYDKFSEEFEALESLASEMEVSSQEVQKLEREDYYFEDEQAKQSYLEQLSEELEGIDQKKIEELTEYESRLKELEQEIQGQDRKISEIKRSYNKVQKKVSAEENIQDSLENNPHAQLAQCGGEQLRSLDLSKQFPPTKSQGNYGTCYSYAGVGVIESTLYRNSLDENGSPTYEVRSYDPQAAAVCTIADESCFYRLRDLKNAFNDDRDFCHTGFINGGYPGRVLDTFLEQSGQDQPHFLFEEERGTGQKVDELNRRVKCELEKALGQDRDTTLHRLESDMKDIYRHSLREWGKEHGIVPIEDIQDYEKLSIMDNERSHFPGVKEEIEKYGDLLKEDKEDDPADCHLKQGSKFKERVEKVMGELCEGRPVAVSLLTSGLEFKSDSKTAKGWKDGEWYKYPANDSQHGLHAMVVQGVDYDENGEPVFMMRNSWREGDEERKNASLSRLRFREMCRVFDIQGLKGPNEPEQGKKLDKELGTIQFAR